MKTFGIAFHGVPEGFDTYGTLGRSYCESIFNLVKDGVCNGADAALIVETGKDTAGMCSYYTYLVSFGVVSNSSAAGSYFGMTLKADGEYCTDVYSLYEIFEQIYRDKVDGILFESTEYGKKYRFSTFDSVSEKLDGIVKLFQDRLTSKLENSFASLNSSFSLNRKSGEIVYFHVVDTNRNAFLDTIKANGIVAVSTRYPSADLLSDRQKTSSAAFHGFKGSSRHKKHRRRTVLKYLRNILMAVLLFLVLLQYFNGVDKDEKIASLESELLMVKQLQDGAQSIGDVQQNTVLLRAREKAAKKDAAVIEMFDSNQKPVGLTDVLKIGKKYTVRCNSAQRGHCEWRPDGFKMKGPKFEPQIDIYPTQKFVTLSFYIEGNQVFKQSYIAE